LGLLYVISMMIQFRQQQSAAVSSQNFDRLEDLSQLLAAGAATKNENQAASIYGVNDVSCRVLNCQ